MRTETNHPDAIVMVEGAAVLAASVGSDELNRETRIDERVQI
jgi:hypothetical protein